MPSFINLFKFNKSRKSKLLFYSELWVSLWKHINKKIINNFKSFLEKIIITTLFDVKNVWIVKKGLVLIQPDYEHVRKLSFWNFSFLLKFLTWFHFVHRKKWFYYLYNLSTISIKLFFENFQERWVVFSSEISWTFFWQTFLV
jgi:hypothetical protein